MQSSLSRFRSLRYLWFALSAFGPVNLDAQTPAGWPQFGGPLRNFTSPSKGLANTWPAEGPRKVWSRPLGEGYSGIAVGRRQALHDVPGFGRTSRQQV